MLVRKTFAGFASKCVLQGRIADFVVKEPMVIGHESAG